MPLRHCLFHFDVFHCRHYARAYVTLRLRYFHCSLLIFAATDAHTPLRRITRHYANFDATYFLRHTPLRWSVF